MGETDGEPVQGGGERTFHHPYQPYDIQQDFMSSVFECLEDGKVGIFESPTGTGKSLSLICGSLTWLRHHKRVELQGKIDASDDEGEPEWMQKFAREQRINDALSLQREMAAKLKVVRAKEERARQRMESGESKPKRPKLDGGLSAGQNTNVDDTLYALDDYESELENDARSKSSTQEFLSGDTLALMKKLGMTSDLSSSSEVELDDELKVFYCSRTHSQLTQFVHELRRVKMPPVTNGMDLAADHTLVLETDVAAEFKHVALGSRKTLCINKKVLALGNATAINERCLELQQNTVSKELKCPYLPTKETEAVVHDFRDHTLAKIRDIEDFAVLGNRLNLCPYYATRAAIKPAEIVTLPYPLLLQKSAREALQLSLKGHVVIIDEAHNLMDAIANINSVSVSLSQLQQARAQITQYLQKFKSRLKGKNRIYVTQLVRVIDSLIAYLISKLASGNNNEGQVEVDRLLAGKGVDQINLYKLMKYLQDSKLARKVSGYATFATLAERTAGTGQKVSAAETQYASTTPVLTQVQSFFQALTFPGTEGRFFYSNEIGTDECRLKYLLLDPTQQFRDVVSEARAVVLAGGTMSPMDDYKDHLLGSVEPHRLMTRSYGHVIPTSNLLATPIAKSASGVEFDFTFGKRDRQPMIRELGLTILQLAKRVPDGMVVFFPSYAYLNSVVHTWNQNTLDSGEPQNSILASLNDEKKLFLEPNAATRGTADGKAQPQTVCVFASVDETLSAYSDQVDSGHGALMFAVVGGSLSEGINFSDRLGRCIVVVGLPFPNAHSPEWKAKLDFQRHKTQTSTFHKASDSPKTNEMLENACMRAVNQSIGRAIRHKHDYATIFLIDRRFARLDVQRKLSSWIQKSLLNGRSFVDSLLDVEQFFNTKSRVGVV